MRNRISKPLALLLCAGVMISGAAFAADTTLNKDFNTLEGSGLLHTHKDGALGDGVWRGADRDTVFSLIEGMPLTSERPSSQQFIDSILLGSSNTQELEGSGENAAQDLLTLRIEKLLEAGRYDKALELFSALGEDAPRSPELARTEMLAMMGDGQKSLACLETKTRDTGADENGFWAALSAYCDYTLSDSPMESAKAALEESKFEILRTLAFNPTFVFAYDQAAFNALSKLERTVLISEQRIEAPNLTPDAIHALPEGDLSAMLALETIPPAQHGRLEIRAVELGMRDDRHLGLYYKAFDIAGAPEFKPAVLYKTLYDDKPGIDKNALLRQVLDLRGDYGIGALQPFAKFYTESMPSGLSLQEMGTLLNLFYRAKQPIPDSLLENFLKYEPTESQKDLYNKVLSGFFLLSSEAKRHELSKIVQKIDPSGASEDFYAIYVIENLDKGSPDADNAAKVYEKDLATTEQTHDVVPSAALWDRLRQAGQNKILGETVLLSIYILHEHPIGGLNPAQFRDLVENLNIVGLTHVSKALAIESQIGDL